MDVEVKDETVAKKISKDDLKDLELSGVKLTSDVLGKGCYGTVYIAEYKGTACAAKRVNLRHSQPVAEQTRVEQSVMLECLQHSKLLHSNIVKMLGVYYPENGILPCLVMEMMECNLTQLLENHQNIAMYVKLSILQDVSRGLCYLHGQNPPIVHQSLYSDNILVTKNFKAKIGGFMTVTNQEIFIARRMATNIDFLPDMYYLTSLRYDVSVNVFSFGCIVCHVVNQEWPSTLKQVLLRSQPTDLKLRHNDHQPDRDVLFSNVTIHRRPTKVMVNWSFRKNRLSYTMDDWYRSVEKHHNFIHMIYDNSLQLLVEACLQRNPKYRPHMSLIYERITSIMTDHYNDDDNIKSAYMLAMKQGLDQSKNFQLMIIGAENTGKTNLISTLLGEEFVEGQSATKGVDVEVCKVYCKDWVKITHSDKSDILHSQFSTQCKDNTLKAVADFSGSSIHSTDSSIHLSTESTSYNLSTKRSSSTHSDLLFSTVPLTHSMMALSHSATYGNSSKPHPQHLQETSIQDDFESSIASLWDFAGQTIFHNSHSVFISDGGVTVITFNASMELTDSIITREGSPLPPECCTIISSIHYWLQVVNSVCSVEENVLLVGTHIDKLHPDIKEARKIARKKILPLLEMELLGKPYAKHIADVGELGLQCALTWSCFFVSNKCRDNEEMQCLQERTVHVAASLRKQKAMFFLKIEQALLQLNKQVISVSMLLDLVAENTFLLDKNSPEFKGLLKYFHGNRIILHFSEIESLKDLVILSPNWLAKLFSYIIAAHSYKTGGTLDWAWKRLTKYGILHECLLQHMLEKFHSDYPVAGSVQITRQQAVDVLLCFRLLARISSKAWFAEEGFPPLPDSGDTFIVPSLVCADDDRNPPETEDERIVYFMFSSGFIPTSLLNQLIAECICRSVRRNDRLLWMRRGKMGSQLGVDQKYYISRCETKQSILLTITVKGDDEEHVEERKCLIDDITKSLDDIMKVFMPATKERPYLLIPCLFCSLLHIPLDDACSGKIIFCPNANDKSLPHGYYSDLLQGRSSDATTMAGNKRKSEVFTTYYYQLACLNFKALSPHLVAARVISHEDNQIIQHTIESSKVAEHVLGKISASLRAGIDDKFDAFLSVLEKSSDLVSAKLAEQIRSDLNSITTVSLSTVKQVSHQSVKISHEEIIDSSAVENVSLRNVNSSYSKAQEATELTPLVQNPNGNHQNTQSSSCKGCCTCNCCNLM